ncbi:SOS response-associated peptidase [Chitinimonas sp. PSY-7]|uniref:SOS response-associated peptidase family protein n=1 Tax=Chitinimonas sp. PSY-7 TaxID=3459088 RepID=UPI004040279C
MCACFDLENTRGRLSFEQLFSVPQYNESNNVRPTTFTPIIRLDSAGQLECVTAFWWFVPANSKSKAEAVKNLTTFNARCERIATARTYKDAYAKRRCLVPAAAVFEWEEEPSLPKKKRKFRVSRMDDELLIMAGIWEHWESKETNEAFDSYSIVTTEANTVFKGIPHSRMPVLLAREHWDWWLDTSMDATPLFQPSFDDALQAVDLTGIV